MDDSGVHAAATATAASLTLRLASKLASVPRIRNGRHIWVIHRRCEGRPERMAAFRREERRVVLYSRVSWTVVFVNQSNVLHLVSWEVMYVFARETEPEASSFVVEARPY